MVEHSTDQAFAGPGPYGGPNEPTYAGATSFMRRPYAKSLDGVDLAVFGVPLDLATTGRPGARLGPRGVRAASTNLAWGKPFPWGFDPFAKMAAIDRGDVWFDMGAPGDFAPRIQAFAAEIAAAGAVPLAIGGDHFITLPILRALRAAHGAPISIIHFDAHSDTWADEETAAGGPRLDHGTMFWWAAKEGVVDPATSAQLGVRTHNDDRMGFTWLDAPFIHAAGVDETLRRLRAVTGDRPVYVTFDIDCLDPAFAPGTGTPVPGGLSAAQALALLRGLQGRNFLGFDVVEVAPPFDHAEVTALAAAQIALEYCCLLADARGRR